MECAIRQRVFRDAIFKVLWGNPTSKHEIDRIIVRKNGVFCIEDKDWKGTSMALRTISYEARDYPVNDKFPKITKDSFKEGHFPSGIVKVEYTISLDGLEYMSLLGGTKEDVKDVPVGSK